ncbi:hypothetical protein [Winogradskyella sp.]|uniref:hypothetical protein n=1 Tax=Winogradskyella sp. TaxID=1883156 RepID=UPI001B1F3E74|nr:hypothetical protein [Winogradskyella sp.]MBO6881926.1 hypothetical protein [Winogradskyella sp.]
MKKFFLLLTVTSSLLFQACIGWGSDDADDIDPFPTGSYEPVIMQRTDFEAATILENTPRTIENSGKIYVKDNFIFVNEVNQGFHLINNTDPTNPINIGFIKVLGSSDLSIKEDVFYANNATDLIAFKIDEATETLTITKRLENVFPQIWSPEGVIYYPIEDNEVIVDWELIN